MRERLDVICDETRDLRADEVMIGLSEAIVMVDMFHAKNRVSPTMRVCQIKPDRKIQELLEHAAATIDQLSKELLKHVSCDTDNRGLRGHLACEELAEQLSAMADLDEAQLLDALADRLYILCGDACAWDLPLAEAFVEVHRSNMTKERQKNDKHGARVRSKGPNYKPPAIHHVLAEYRSNMMKPHSLTDDACVHCGMSSEQVFKQISKYGKAKCKGHGEPRERRSTST